MLINNGDDIEDIHNVLKKHYDAENQSFIAHQNNAPFFRNIIALVHTCEILVVGLPGIYVLV